ncbi:hypothetical protein ROHU_001310 [Labeo rohita]|uniref:Uncharacterized protein n=1 Tax=Labeo rohita TaxID=84645 RepID=A0A498P0X2_LABRO|nr:hypothetical protein ROHU_001310 [Labeo rohita]
MPESVGGEASGDLHSIFSRDPQPRTPPLQLSHRLLASFFTLKQAFRHRFLLSFDLRRETQRFKVFQKQK